MPKLMCIVEGHGDAKALPELLRHIFAGIQVAKPWRIHADRLLKGDLAEARNAIQQARREAVDGVLVLLDTDCEPAKCPKKVAVALRAKLGEIDERMPLALVLAECEFETWFLEAAESLRGKRGLPIELERPGKPLSIRGAKEWLGQRMPRGYSETVDQPALAAVMDIEAARRNSRSFQKLCDEVMRLCL